MAKCLKAENDMMGKALLDYQNGHVGAQLTVRINDFEDDPYEVSYFFRNYDEMPMLEQEALKLASGDILDVGAGTGIHSLALQKMNKNCKSIEISELSVEVMKKRGVENAVCQDFFEIKNEKYDTILLLMNGIGLVENMAGFKNFFKHCKTLLKPNGQILFDSSDLIYLFEEEDGSFLIELGDKYYGEVIFEIAYECANAKPFPWLFIDFDNLQHYASKNGFNAELIQAGEHYDYLARLAIK